MLQSMTAYGRSDQHLESGEFSCELRSVNSRYLDVVLRLPDSLRHLETQFKELLNSRVQRGKVEVMLKFTETAKQGQSIEVNHDALKQLSEVAKKIDESMNLRSQVDVVKIMQWPGVLTVSDNTVAKRADEATTVFARALNDFIEHRQREGEQIGQILKNKGKELEQLLIALRQRRPQVIARQKEKWMDKLAVLATAVDEKRIEQEIVLVAQRLDIEEEIDRLHVHLQELNNAIERKDPVGRRLDFLMQEFNREANTISSKSADSVTTGLAVDMKVLIEQMREQVQNVE